jgi:hypothetical protein
VSVATASKFAINGSYNMVIAGLENWMKLTDGCWDGISNNTQMVICQ